MPLEGEALLRRLGKGCSRAKDEAAAGRVGRQVLVLAILLPEVLLEDGHRLIVDLGVRVLLQPLELVDPPRLVKGVQKRVGTAALGLRSQRVARREQVRNRIERKLDDGAVVDVQHGEQRRDEAVVDEDRRAAGVVHRRRRLEHVQHVGRHVERLLLHLKLVKAQTLEHEPDQPIRGHERLNLRRRPRSHVRERPAPFLARAHPRRLQRIRYRLQEPGVDHCLRVFVRACEHVAQRAHRRRRHLLDAAPQPAHQR
mmetsp:Transcript_8324/g.18129  ORF Transcript_8324/g.18129 Transcript_8324/m.18129 type:complete len:255 (-) Transcript_8324:974-1738(-)